MLIFKVWSVFCHLLRHVSGIPISRDKLAGHVSLSCDLSNHYFPYKQMLQSPAVIKWIIAIAIVLGQESEAVDNLVRTINRHTLPKSDYALIPSRDAVGCCFGLDEYVAFSRPSFMP